MLFRSVVSLPYISVKWYQNRFVHHHTDSFVLIFIKTIVEILVFVHIKIFLFKVYVLMSDIIKFDSGAHISSIFPICITKIWFWSRFWFKYLSCFYDYKDRILTHYINKYPIRTNQTHKDMETNTHTKYVLENEKTVTFL